MGSGGRATSLTADSEGGRLYWTDQDSLTLSYTSLTRYVPHLIPDTRQLRPVPSPGAPVSSIVVGSHPYGLTLYSSWLFLTDWQEHTVARLPLPPTNSSTPVILQTGLDYVMDLLAYTSTPPASPTPSPCSSHPCSGLCIPRGEAFTCSCPSHYTLAADRANCTSPSSFLLYSQKNKISRLLLEDEAEGEVPDMVLPIKRARSIQAVSYDPLEGMIYWVDHGRGSEQPARQVIRRARDTGGADRLQLFDRADHFLPYDLVINPYTQTLYWTCANTNTINATRLGPKLRPLGPVLVGGEGTQPRLLALHAATQQLVVSMAGDYSAEEGRARLETIDLATADRRLLVETSVGAVTALTVDAEEQECQVYWADIIHKRLESVGGDGSGRRVVVGEGVVEPVGLAVMGDWLYWADRDQATLARVRKLSGTGRQIVLAKVPRLSSLTAVPRIARASLLAHPCSAGHGCSHFCAALATGGVRCSCPMGLVLAPDNRTCGAPPTCAPKEFTCASTGTTGSGPACIPHTWRCDGQPECADKSDELDCPECGPNQFRCQSSQCVPSSQLCDGTPHCDDRTDEKLCCGESEFQCAVTGECVSKLKLCDGEHDCGDSSDELLTSCSALAASGGSPAGTPCCPDPSTRRLGSEAATTATSFYLIVVFAVLISIFLLGLMVVYCRRRSGLRGTGGLESDSRRPLAPALPGIEGVAAAQERGRAVGAEPGVVSAAAGSSNGLLYDRSHVTGASSTGGTSSSGCAGAQGPPPSPATSVGTKLSRLGASSHRSKSLGRAKPSFVTGLPTGYRFYTHRAAPPCTPCSTDVADESDYAPGPLYGRQHFTSRAGSTVQSRTGYDSETYGREEDFPAELPSLLERGRYAPPPTTPLYLSDYCGEEEDSSRAPSPTTERSFFLNPCLPGPPPSPIPSHPGD